MTRPQKFSALAVALLLAGWSSASAAESIIETVGFLGCTETCCDDVCCDDTCCDPCCDDVCCDTACCDGCVLGKDCCGYGGLGCGLLSLIQPSDHCFDDFISPMINFTHFEDPRTLTEIRPIYVHHNVPGSLGGGNIHLAACQIRVALSKELSIIAVKDGYIWDETNGTLGGLLDDGWADMTAGLKYNLLRDECSGTLVSAGLTYEIPLGSQRALQAQGDGVFHVFGTMGQRFCDGNAHIISEVGYRFPLDSSAQTTALHWSNHFDVRLMDKFYLVTEFAWWHWLDDAGNGLPLGVGGQDLFNLPANNVAGNDLVTQNVGVKVKPNKHMEVGLAYEFPITGFKDVINERIQLDVILRY
ncbi:hypothetical protein [Calycomorphotria hydatis]|uniref:Uncharacterized protein n=1 Tax=Calycomorphotria hydatis TaxID=2528027 RepID=A0A517T530_9PLAN|nr:hypothetical protein [Calycomorphotria hydatis]QDT63485.1 hypothetical protein V22_07070 [Calycomorphotria hydatis]